MELLPNSEFRTIAKVRYMLATWVSVMTTVGNGYNRNRDSLTCTRVEE